MEEEEAAGSVEGAGFAFAGLGFGGRPLAKGFEEAASLSCLKRTPARLLILLITLGRETPLLRRRVFSSIRSLTNWRRSRVHSET